MTTDFTLTEDAAGQTLNHYAPPPPLAPDNRPRTPAHPSGAGSLYRNGGLPVGTSSSQPQNKLLLSTVARRSDSPFDPKMLQNRYIFCPYWQHIRHTTSTE